MSIYQAWSRALSGEFMYSAFHQIDEQKWVIAYCPAVSKRHVTTVWKLIDYALKDGVHNEINGLILQSLPCVCYVVRAQTSCYLTPLLFLPRSF